MASLGFGRLLAVRQNITDDLSLKTAKKLSVPVLGLFKIKQA